MTSFKCRQCKEVKPVSEARIQRDRPVNFCKSCRNTNAKSLYIKDSGRSRERVSRYKNTRWISHYITTVFYNTKRNSEKKGVPFNLTTEYLRNVMAEQNESCFLSGLPFERSGTPGVKHARSPSLDRIKPELGYTMGNVRFLCDGLNSAKSTGTDDQLLEMCRAVVEKNS